jgi:hypothetical protein
LISTSCFIPFVKHLLTGIKYIFLPYAIFRRGFAMNRTLPLSFMLALAACTLSDNAPTASPIAPGLACFADDWHKGGAAQTCDALCAGQNAACVSAALADNALLLPEPSCSDPQHALALTCRCCAIHQ